MVACFSRSCSRHQECVTAEALEVRATGGAFYYQKQSLTNSGGSRVQCRGRGSNVAAGENDLGFEVTAE